jgi:cytochrome c nitrite reductase small subunit
MSPSSRLSAGTKWGLLVLLGVAPALLSLATFDLSFKRAETLDFCSSCHAMTPWVSDLKDPNSKSFASLHYRNRFILEDQCYRCHADYDFLGPVHAKLDGVRHVVAYYTGFGMHHPITLYKPFPNGNCLQCHGAAANFNQNPTHAAVMAQIRSDELHCLDCHNPIHTPKEKE